MLFDCSPSAIESEKERNLYAKFFIGYWFNELVPGIADRVEQFDDLISSRIKATKYSHLLPFHLNPADLHVTMDLHAYILGANEDRGELADLLIQVPSQGLCFLIEVKYLSAISVTRDLRPMFARMDSVSSHMPQLSLIPCVLVAKHKWNRAETQKSRGASNYSRYMSDYSSTTALLFWEDFLPNCTKSIAAFMRERLRLVMEPKSQRLYQPPKQPAADTL